MSSLKMGEARVRAASGLANMPCTEVATRRRAPMDAKPKQRLTSGV